MKKLLIGILTLSFGASAFAAYDVKHCGQVRAVLTVENKVLVTVRDEKGNDYGTPVSKNLEAKALEIALISLQNEKLTICTYVTWDEITDIAVFNFNLE